MFQKYLKIYSNCGLCVLWLFPLYIPTSHVFEEYTAPSYSAMFAT